VPLPLALIVRFSFVPLDITLTAKPLPAAAALTLKPVAAEGVEASTLKDGLVEPLGPAVSSLALVPVSTNDVPVAAPRTGVVRVGEVARTMLPEPVVTLPSAVTVPDVGNVRLVAADTVNVVANAPEIASVLAALLAIPVPPLAGDNMPDKALAGIVVDAVTAPDPFPYR